MRPGLVSAVFVGAPMILGDTQCANFELGDRDLSDGLWDTVYEDRVSSAYEMK